VSSPAKYALGKRALSTCDRCGRQYLRKTLKEIVVKLRPTNLLVCKECWEEDHPQLQTGMYPVQDAQSIRNPRPDTALDASRSMQWGWGPIGLHNVLGLTGINDKLQVSCKLGTVTVTTSSGTSTPSSVGNLNFDEDGNPWSVIA
jgi:hypothetical protein